ncbi:MAG: S41 family peptidase [Myxococcota bacterium]
MHTSLRSVALVGFLAWVPSQALAQNVQAPLSQVRNQIQFPSLTAQEKLTIAQEAKVMLDIYVHRFEKQSFYPGVLDPVPAAAQVLKDIDSLSVAEMEERLYRIFASQRDLHLNYVFPPPYSQWSSFLPFTLARTQSRRDRFEARVSSVSAQLFAQYAPGQRVPVIGDKLIAYGGLPIADAIREQQETSQGANEFGGFVRAIDELTFISHLLHLVPPTDTVELTFLPDERRAHPYTITLPWITEGPAAESVAETTTEGAATQGGVFSGATPDYSDRKAVLKALSSGEDLYEKERQRFLSAHPELRPMSPYPNLPTNEPTITFGRIHNPNGRFGYIRISSFVPAFGDNFAIEEIRRLLLGDLEDTDGLIVDVRDNGGGSIIYADLLSQLFGRNDARVIEARLLNVDLNRRIFNESAFGFFFPDFAASINDAAGTGNTYAETVPFTSLEDANALGQAYDRPVAVLMNARSYSATDLFTCSMKDNDQAIIFGQDGRTGAGGANVIAHSLFATFVPSVFTPLPAGHQMRTSWRQSVRFDANRSLVEDFGCAADVDVSRNVEDLANGDEDQILKITRQLRRERRQRRYRAEIRPLEEAFQVDLEENDQFYGLFATNTRDVRVTLNGQVVETRRVNARRRERLVEFDFSALEPGTFSNVTFEGLDASGARLWNLRKRFFIVPEPQPVGAAGFEVDFATAATPAPFVVSNVSAPENGWNLVSPFLQLGFTPNYADNVNSDALAVLDISSLANPVVDFDLEYITEAGFDFIEVFVVDESGDATTLLLESGVGPLQTYTFSLAPFAGQVIQLHFRFTSDAFVNDLGVRLGRVRVTDAP